MSETEFADLAREVRRRVKAIQSGEISRRITVADLDRIDMNLAIDRAYVAQAEARIQAHWHDWSHGIEPEMAS